MNFVAQSVQSLLPLQTAEAGGSILSRRLPTQRVAMICPPAMVCSLLLSSQNAMCLPLLCFAYRSPLLKSLLKLYDPVLAAAHQSVCGTFATVLRTMCCLAVAGVACPGYAYAAGPAPAAAPAVAAASAAAAAPQLPAVAVAGRRRLLHK